MINSNKLRITPMHMSLIFILIYIFFYSISFISSKAVLTLAILFALIAWIFEKKKGLNLMTKENTIFELIILLNIISLFYTTEFSGGLRFVIVLIIMFSYNLILSSTELTFTFTIKVITAFSFVHVIMTLLQIIFPGFVTIINQKLLSSIDFMNNLQSLTNYSYFCGINGYSHTNAFYIGIFISIIFTRLIFIIANKQGKGICRFILLFSLLFLSLIALFATQKRGLVLATFIAMFVTIVFYLRQRKKAIIYFVIITVIIVFGLILLVNYNAQTQKIYLRFTGNNNFYSNRDLMYQIAYNGFLEKPILGHGVASTYSILDKGAHNIYLQILYDNGLFGLLLYLLFFIYSFLKTIKTLFKNINGIKGQIALMVSLYIQILFLAYGMSGNPLFDNFIFFIYIIVISIPYAIISHYKCNLLGGKTK